MRISTSLTRLDYLQHFYARRSVTKCTSGSVSFVTTLESCGTLMHGAPLSVQHLAGLLTMYLGSPSSLQTLSLFVATTLVAPVAVITLVQQLKIVSMLAVCTALARTFDQALESKALSRLKCSRFFFHLISKE